MTLAKLLGASKKIANDLQEHLCPRNKAVIALEYQPMVAETKMQMISSCKKSELINLEVTLNGHPVNAIIDTRLQLNILVLTAKYRLEKVYHLIYF